MICLSYYKIHLSFVIRVDVSLTHLMRIYMDAPKEVSKRCTHIVRFPLFIVVTHSRNLMN